MSALPLQKTTSVFTVLLQGPAMLNNGSLAEASITEFHPEWLTKASIAVCDIVSSSVAHPFTTIPLCFGLSINKSPTDSSGSSVSSTDSLL
ncbi:hypothetical protein Tco_1412287 [Tanacetum coccineum]